MYNSTIALSHYGTMVVLNVLCVLVQIILFCAFLFAFFKIHPIFRFRTFCSIINIEFNRFSKSTDKVGGSRRAEGTRLLISPPTKLVVMGGRII